MLKPVDASDVINKMQEMIELRVKKVMKSKCPNLPFDPDIAEAVKRDVIEQSLIEAFSGKNNLLVDEFNKEVPAGECLPKLGLNKPCTHAMHDFGTTYYLHDGRRIHECSYKEIGD